MMTVTFEDLYTKQPGYHEGMKLFCILGLALALPLAPAAENKAPDPRLSAVRSVYILPMSGGMDQYLANRLTSMGVLQVAADPKNADAILTDRLGETFERRMADLYPEPAPAKSKDEEQTEKASSSSAAAEMAASAAPRVSSFNRGRGNFFLVDRRTRNVLWSTYEKPEGMGPERMTHTAEKIARQLRDARAPKQ
jgi:hypothetical protein